MLRTIVLFLSFLFISNSTFAQNVEISGVKYSLYKNLLGGDRYASVIRKNTNYSGDIVIPDFVNYEGLQYPVRSMGDIAFASSDITSITLSDSINKIFDNCFSGCSKLKTIKFPKNLRYIYKGAFKNCKEIEYIDLPKNVWEIAESAFRGCSSLTTVFLRTENDLFIKSGNFSECNNLCDFICLSNPEKYVINEFERKSSCTLHVPKEFVETAKKSQYLSTFGRIVEINDLDMAYIYLNVKDYNTSESYFLKAQKTYENLFTQNPEKYRADLASIQNNMGILYINLQNNAKAEKCFLKALENYNQLFSKNPDGYRAKLATTLNTLAYSYANQNKFDKAIETIDRAIALIPEVANFYDSKGEILLMKGDEKGALDMWRKVVEIDSDFVKKYADQSVLYKTLKAKGLIKE